MAGSLSGLLRYPGGKTKLRKPILKKLLDLVGSNQRYVEPFFGGGSIGCEFIKNSDITSIWVNDADAALVALWNSVIYHSEELKQMVWEFRPSTDYFYGFKEALSGNSKSDDTIWFGFMKLALHQMSYSGLGTKSGGPLGGKEQSSKYKIDCRWSPKNICKKIDELHGLLSEINVKCTSLDFADLILDNSQNSLLYLDPPYYVKGNDLYECGFTEADHQRLADLLFQTKHTWVLSYDDCSEIRNLYKWAVIEELPVKYSITMSGEEKGRGKDTEIELLIFNSDA